jgi:GNAT superfamily N-acetyltransferase
VKHRLAVVADAAAIADLHLASWRSAYKGFVRPGTLEALEQHGHASVWSRRIVVPEVRVELLEDRQGLLAFCAHGPSGDPDAPPGPKDRWWEIKNLHVRPELRRTGAGGRLFDRAVSHARSVAAAAVTLWVVEQNDAARNFYLSRGMVSDGATTTHVVGTDDSIPVVRYRLPL